MPINFELQMNNVFFSISVLQIKINIFIYKHYLEHTYIRQLLTDYVKLVHATMETDEFKVYSEKLETRRDDGVVLA